MTRTDTYRALHKQQLRRNRAGTKNLSREQQQALGNLALIGGPAFIVGLWGLTAFTSGLLSVFTSTG